MGTYRKKPVVVEAVQYDGDNATALVDWMDASDTRFTPAAYNTDTGTLSIATLEGDMHVSVGDYVIKGVQGEFYPCKPDIFDATYEAVETAGA